jgi:hypothetical protein
MPITGEVYGVEHAFESAPAFEKKRRIRQFVLDIHMDRDDSRALCYIMKMPTVSHPAMTVPKESLRDFVTIGIFNQCCALFASR